MAIANIPSKLETVFTLAPGRMSTSQLMGPDCICITYTNVIGTSRVW